MGEGLTDPLEISKQPDLIQAAQKDLSKLDVLICGECHDIFHFIEEFQEHKEPGKCSQDSSLKKACENESKSQVWAFTLWKNKQIKIKTEENFTSWSIYQRWCKLSPEDKEIWMKAGEAVQWQNKIGTGKVFEMKPLSVMKKSPERDPLSLDDDANATSMNGNKKGLIPGSKEVNPNAKSAYRTAKVNPEQYVVEKILAKRFTPKKKTWEYKIKWENFPEHECTWEPLAHLESCKTMVDEFEENLRKLKFESKKQAAALTPVSPRGRGRPRLSTASPSPSSASSIDFDKDKNMLRPQRTSKQKALNQVKAWCGNISDNEDGTLKRGFDDDSSDDSFEKRMKIEAETDESDDDKKKKPIIIQKKSQLPKMGTINNGVGVSGKLPDNILIPDAKGVVRINQKQLPSLSSGVYIMSKTAGIIKLDSATSKIATSGGQAIVKVAPKIGHTHIKIVKKDGETTNKIIQMSPKLTPPSKQPQQKVAAKSYNKTSSLAKVKKIVYPEKPKLKPVEVAKDPLNTNDAEEPKDDDSDYGLEEMEFPTDIPIPEPESPQGDFVLDPTTGKIAGQEYPDPEPEPVTKTDETNGVSGENTLDNIVKLAAADITEDDLKPLPDENESMLVSSVEETNREDDSPALDDSLSLNISQTPETDPVQTETSPKQERQMPTSTSKVVSSGKSIISTTLTGTSVLQKTLQSPLPRPKPPQRILNQSVARPAVSPLIRQIPHKAMSAKSKFQITSTPIKKPMSHKMGPTTVAKIGNTQIKTFAREQPKYTTKKVVYKHAPIRAQTIYKPVIKKTHPVVLNSSISPVKTKPRPVISMPTLSSEDEPVVTQQPETSTSVAEESSVIEPDLSSFSLADNESPIFITGDDGTVYQVAGQNEQGQTILITQGADGQQQCLLVTSEPTQEDVPPVQEEEPETHVLPSASMDVQEPLSINTTDTDSQDQVVAQVVRAEPPSPGGTHKVVVMLPDGNLMVTQVTPEEYASLELDT